MIYGILRGLYMFKIHGWIFTRWSNGILETEGSSKLILSSTGLQEWLDSEGLDICTFWSMKLSRIPIQGVYHYF